MAQVNWKRRLAGLAVVVLGGWELFYWLNDVAGRTPWTFGLGFATAALIFGFWDSAAPPAKIEARRKPLENAPSIDELDTLLEDLISEGQVSSAREQKAAERLARYDEA